MRAQLASWGSALALAVAALAVSAPSAAAIPSSRNAAPVSGAVELPGDVTIPRSVQGAGSWIVGARPSPSAGRLARRFGARSILPDAGVYRVAPARARVFADALRASRLLTFAEPDRLRSQQAFPSDPYAGAQWALPAIGATSLTPPAVTDSSPTLAILEDEVELDHGEFAGARISVTRQPGRGEHGTAVTSVAAAPQNGRGILGVWPGMNVLISPARNSSCSAAVEAIAAAVKRKAAVINMSYGFDGGCRAHRVATNRAFGLGTVLVAAAGNEFEEGNPSDQSPSADPHVITVGSLKQDLSAAPFSNAHDGVDLSAPGVGVLAAVPLGDDQDGVLDGYTPLDGTSFSSPIVAAATTWVAAVRPDINHTQLTDLMRYSARDLGAPGWERRFGFGILDLPAALSERAPARDPLEPNDDVEWINGTHFKGADRPISRGIKRLVRFRARVDRLEDPADVYRVLVPARRSLRITVTPSRGNPDLEVYSRRARTVFSRRGRIAGSHRSGKRSDRLRLTNYSRKRRLAYVAVYPASLDAAYRIAVRRTRFTTRGRRVR